MLTFARRESVRMSPALIWWAIGSISFNARSRSLRVTVKVTSAMRSTLAFWTIVSMLIPASDRGPKRVAAMPGRSGTPRTVTLATSVS
jgi:hypothetical protein